MALLDGIHHLSSITADLDRLIAFYTRVFDAHVHVDLEEEGLRHALIQVGPSSYLHPFEVPGLDVPQGDIPMFSRGRLDHFAFNVATEEAFRELRRRVVAEGVADGRVVDMGPILLFGFKDPDGAAQEVVWVKPDAPQDRSGRRAEWTTMDME